MYKTMEELKKILKTSNHLSKEFLMEMMMDAFEFGEDEGNVIGYKECLDENSLDIDEDEIRNEGYDNGREEGYDEGYDEGRREGYESGYEDGKNDTSL